MVNLDVILGDTNKSNRVPLRKLNKDYYRERKRYFYECSKGHGFSLKINKEFVVCTCGETAHRVY